jgi:hypothetical protein
MRSISLLTFVIISNCTITLAQQNLYKGNNLLMPENMLVNYRVAIQPFIDPINGNSMDTVLTPYWECNNVQNLIGIILNGVFKQKVDVYDPDYLNSDNYNGLIERIDLMQVKHRMDMETRTITVLDNSGKYVEKTIDSKIDTSEFFSLAFLEDWTVNKKPFSMTKVVRAYAPIRKFYKGGDNSGDINFKIAFLCLDTIDNSKDALISSKRMMMTNKIKYEYFLIPDVNDDIKGSFKNYFSTIWDCGGEGWLHDYKSPYFNNVSKSRFLDMLINKALKENHPVYDFETNKQLTIDQINENFDAGIDTILVENFEEPGSFIKRTVERTIRINELKSIIFDEEWYIDPVNLRMQKKVVAVSPVRYYYHMDDPNYQNPIRKIAFTIYFEGMQR